MSFPAIMVLLVVITGLIWLVDKLVFARIRSADGKEPAVVEYARSFFPIILAVLVIRSFVAEPFRIPSGSMLPTLHVGDFILVNKFSYGLRLPVLNTKFFDSGSPERGDVIVFRFPEEPSIDYIKRVVGLPGDRIGYFNKKLYINRKPVDLEVASAVSVIDEQLEPQMQVYEEKLTDTTHLIAIDPASGSAEGEMIVPEGHYFVLGDNRDRSNDSRRWGTVPEANLVGKAFVIWMSWDWEKGGIIWSRLGRSIN
ncbi:Signal peptidase I [Methylophaga frappieri]|uniref:Signal peptidase I n=1 Tax=Methylophaga frappieri (strain ATCC BAA-2434 / DSM 25690 / JAM7) TaxID=754477 RepID=I1YFA2_METFJ|nr:signal peptidase I [Methylophaga frappieri]AFJ01595.1 Signal peptidase I [Methylophaga frappieri]